MMIRCYRLTLPFLLAASLFLPEQNPAWARVGVTSATDGQPRGKPPSENERILRIGIDVQENEVVTTGANDRAHLVFLDGTSVTVGPNARVVIDKFVYDPVSQKGDLSVTAAQGVLRIVGGKISKSGPIAIKTPSASMGIRGGIAIVTVEPQLTTSTFVFGKKMTITAQGSTQELLRPGSQVTVNLGTPPGQPILIGPGALNAAMAQLEGRRAAGNAAGSGSNRADQGAQNFGKQNSAQTGVGDNQAAALDYSNSVTNAVANGKPQQGEPPTSTTAAIPTRVIVTNGRFLADPAYSSFNSGNLSVTPDAANNQLIKQSASISAGTSQKQITLELTDGRKITLPWQTDSMKVGFPIGTYIDPTFGVITGTGYVSANGDFFAYVLTDANNKKLGFIGGTPTSSASFPTTGISSYDIENRTGTGRLPFANSSVGDDPNLQATKVVSKLYAAFSPNIAAVIGQPPPGDARSTFMQATLSINGLGSSQKSYMGVFVGDFFKDANNGSTSASGGFSASYRLNSVQQAGRLTSAESTPDVGGANAIFGTRADAILFTPDKLTTTVTTAAGTVTGVVTARTSQASLDQPITNLPGIDYYSVNVATASATPGNVGQNRTSETLQGYVGGVVEQQPARSATFSTRAFGTAGSLPSDVTLTKDASTNRVSASIVVQRWDGTNTSASFQLGGVSGPSYGTSSFIDNGTYALRDRDPTLFQSDTTGVTSQGVTTTGNDVIARTALVSYGAAPTANLFTASGVTPCTCEFLSWGWWSGNISYSNASSYNPGGVDRLNLASYVVGTVTPVAQLPNTGTATYNGHMVGNVVNGVNSYVAAGTYVNVWNFASRGGTVSATFDGANFGGGITANTVSNAGTSNFATSAPVPSTGVPTLRSLSVNGSFFSGGGSAAAYQAGSFGITGTGYKAGGIFAGQKVP